MIAARRIAWTGRSAIVLLLAGASCLAILQTASAQLPFPIGQEPEKSKESEKRKERKERQERQEREEGEENSSTRNEEDDLSLKAYKKPDPVSLPDGPAEALRGPVALVAFKGIVNPGMGEFTVGAIARAEREGAQAVLIELDTPGGLVSTTETIVQAILGAKLPVIVYVSPSGAHAASAGTFITLAGHVAAMAPATRLGAAHPVTGAGKDPEEEGGKHMGRKVENDLVAFVEGIARERGRNVEWAIDAVRSSVSITADKAVEIGVVDLIAPNRAELFERLEGRTLMVSGKKVELHTKGAQVVEYELSIREWIVNTLSNPGIIMILGILGLIGIMVEIYHPGLIAPGVMGVLCIICSLIAVEQLPIDLGAAILVVAGIGLVIAELYTTTYGVLGVLGGVGLTIGLLLLVDTSNPEFSIDHSFGLGLIDVLPVVMLLLSFVGYLSFFVLRTQRARPVTGKEALIGSIGFVLKPVGPSGGTVFVSGEYWQAKADVSILEKEEVEVIRIDGLLLEVRRKQRSRLL